MEMLVSVWSGWSDIDITTEVPGNGSWRENERRATARAVAVCGGSCVREGAGLSSSKFPRR